MFTGFTDETIQFLLDLKFHNTSTYFHEQHDRYVESVQTPFYELINDLADDMRKIDPLMETRPYKCLSRIHRDTRFSRDKSPYRDHHWFLFRRAAEPRDKSLFYYFEFGPDRLGWGMGIWGENRELMDLFRKRMRANPDGTLALIDDMNLAGRHLLLNGRFYKRMDIPSEIPQRLRQWYTGKEIYISRYEPDWKWAFSERIAKEIRKDFLAMAPMYRLLRGCMDDIQKDRTE